MIIVKTLQNIRNFFDSLRDKKSFPTTKKVSKKVSRLIPLHRENLYRADFAVVGNQTSFLQNLGFADIFILTVISKNISRDVSSYREKKLLKWFHNSPIYLALSQLFAKPARAIFLPILCTSIIRKKNVIDASRN